MVNNMTEYKIGTQFKTRGKHPKLCTVVDVLKTYNSEEKHVSTRYVATHDFAGQVMTDRDVIATTIARGLVEITNKQIEG